ncbi:hypothetical protein [Panacagrimonas sp.]|uniref:hypothetical protein n=1 Tax=Panacagrimonas sp. TaxID=2480088 RepID=UPI003B528D78
MKQERPLCAGRHLNILLPPAPADGGDQFGDNISVQLQDQMLVKSLIGIAIDRNALFNRGNSIREQRRQLEIAQSSE